MMKFKKCIIGITAVLVLGMGILATATIHAAPVNSGASIGYVDMQQVVTNSTDYKNAQAALGTEADNMQKEFNEKSAGLNESDKKQLFQQYQQRFELKRQEVMAQVKTKVESAIKDVATAQGIVVVLDKGSVFYGGKDLTQDVVAKVSK